MSIQISAWIAMPSAIPRETAMSTSIPLSKMTVVGLGAVGAVATAARRK